eukprot:COSAG05_NODE_2387_length_3132_cov_1.598088_4_plen_188_part_00
MLWAGCTPRCVWSHGLPDCLRSRSICAPGAQICESVRLLLWKARDNEDYYSCTTTQVNDLAIWVSGFIDAWPPRSGDDSHPLSRASRREMQQVHTAMPLAVADTSAGALLGVQASGYCFGLSSLESLGLGRIIGHSGGYPGSEAVPILLSALARWLSSIGHASTHARTHTHTHTHTHEHTRARPRRG